MELPELNDAFAQTLGEFENVDALRDSVRKSLEANAKEEYDNSYYSKLIDQIREQSKIQYPPQALEEEQNEVLKSIERDLARQNLDLDTYLKVRKLDRDAFTEQEVKPAAIRRLERALLLDEMAHAEKIQLNDKEFERAFTQTMAELQQAEDFDQMRKKISSERMANAIAMEAASRVMNQQVFDRIKRIANNETIEETEEITEVTPSEEEAVPEESESTPESTESTE
jgi:trigger factor